MRSLAFAWFPLCLLCVGCASSNSPTAALIRGDIAADQYFDAVSEANRQSNADAAFETNRDPTRAFNTKTGKFEYVREDTDQSWNEETQRWEFTPVD